MPDTKRSTALAWLSASEARLLASSEGASLTKAGAGDLRRKISRARALRDKWRDVYTAQRRETQQARASRATVSNRRSREKSELFGEVLARLEARLATVTASGTSDGARAKTRPTPRRRMQQHRRERSRTKRALADEVDERESAVARSARADLPPMQTRTAPKKPKKPKKTSKAGTPRGTGKKPGGKDASKGQARDQSRSAAARHRTKVSGLTTRIRGHVSARGKRAQARRDRR
jgi:hypothetical protein